MTIFVSFSRFVCFFSFVLFGWVVGGGWADARVGGLGVFIILPSGCIALEITTKSCRAVDCDWVCRKKRTKGKTNLVMVVVCIGVVVGGGGGL